MLIEMICIDPVLWIWPVFLACAYRVCHWDHDLGRYG